MAKIKYMFFIAIAVVVWASAAYSSEIFIAKNINVDVTSRNSEIARRYAMKQGQEAAFKKILERIVTQKDIPFLPEFSSDEILYLLKEVSVEQESTSPVRYKARLNISFDEEKMKQVLADMGMSFVLSASKPYLLVPVYKQAEETLLLEDNPWKKIWKTNPPEAVLVPFKTLNYDAADSETLKNGVLGRTELLELAEKYNTEGVIKAELYELSENEFNLKISKYVNGSLVETYENPFVFEDKSKNSIMKKIAEFVAKESDNAWRDTMAVNVSKPNLMVVIVPLQSLQHLNSVQKRIENIPLIAKMELKAVQQDRAQINIWHSTNLPNMENAFIKQKFKLIKVGENIFGVEDKSLSVIKPKSSLQSQPSSIGETTDKIMQDSDNI